MKSSNMADDNASERVWQSHYKQLKEWYETNNGSFDIPRDRDDLTSLRLWMTTQRRLVKQGALSATRLQLLEGLPFAWSDKHKKCQNDQDEKEKETASTENTDSSKDDKDTAINTYYETAWYVMFQQLRDFHKKHGHCCIPSSGNNNQNNGNYRGLLRWAAGIRAQPGSLNQRQKDLLNSIGFEWDTCQAKKGGIIQDSCTTKQQQQHKITNKPQLQISTQEPVADTSNTNKDKAKAKTKKPSFPVTPAKLRQARLLARMGHSNANNNNEQQKTRDNHEGSSSERECVDATANKSTGKNYISPRRSWLTRFFAGSESPKPTTDHQKRKTQSSDDETKTQEQSTRNADTIRAVAQAAKLEGSTEIVLKNARAKAQQTGQNQNESLQKSPDGNAAPTLLDKTEETVKANTASPQDSQQSVIKTNKMDKGEEVLVSEEEEQPTSVKSPFYTQRGVDSLDIATNESAGEELGIRQSQQQYNATVVSKGDICSSNSSDRMGESYSVTPPDDNVDDDNYNLHDDYGGKSSLTEEQSDNLIGTIARPGDRDPADHSKWRSMWEAIVHDDDDGDGDSEFLSRDQPPDEISMRTLSHADMSVITMDADYRSCLSSSRGSSSYDKQRSYAIRHQYPQQCPRLNEKLYTISSPANCTAVSRNAPFAEEEPPVESTGGVLEKQTVADSRQKWMKQYYSLVKFFKQHNHCTLPESQEYDTLRAWVNQQQLLLRNDSDGLPLHRRKLLESLLPYSDGTEIGHCPEEKTMATSQNDTEATGNENKTKASLVKHEAITVKDHRDCSPKEKWSAQNGKLVAHYKNLLQFYRENERRSTWKQSNGSLCSSYELYQPNTSATNSNTQPLREVTSARRSSNRPRNEAASPRSHAKRRISNSKAPSDYHDDSLPGDRVDECKSYLEHVDSQIREKEMELKTLRYVAFRINSLLQKVDFSFAETESPSTYEI